MAASDLSSNPSRKYDVFLSFRGPDTRQTFVGHLYKALEKIGLTPFIDNEDLPKGEVIQLLLKAIDDSRLSVLVFSQNYAFSPWCLRELTQIMECKDTKKQIVVPIFYEIQPADVRYQKGKFEDAFAKHEHDGWESAEVLQRWRTALKKAGDLSGWVSSTYNDDAALIDLVVQDIFDKLKESWSSEGETNGLVGMKYHIQQMTDLLCLESNDVRIVGIWGMGGLGKTTIARAVYDTVTHVFEASCFLDKVNQDFKAKGQEQMLEVLLFKIFKLKVRNLGPSNMASEMVVQMLSKKKLLIVLDDVDSLDQFQALCGHYHSFTGGSRIIITTRNRQLLSGFKIYNPRPLENNEALELFRKYAEPSEAYDDLLSTAVQYAQGLPLAVKVLGASLRNKSVAQWKDEFRKIRKYQDKGIEGVLRTSFDGLEKLRQELFLDIACFFRGIEEDYTTLILDACDLFPTIGLSILVDRALVTTSEYYSPVLGMHDLLYDMALGLVRQQESRRHSRLTILDNSMALLTKNTGIEAVESIDMDLSKLDAVEINSEAFVSMKKLRLLRIHYNRSINSVGDYYDSSDDHDAELYKLSDKCKQSVVGDFKFLSHELRCLVWHGCLLKSLPSKFYPEHLVDLDMRCSHIQKLWEGTKPLEKLKFINLSRSPYLKKTPDLSGATNLEKANFEGCTSLLEVHSSISHLKNLVSLNLKGCEELQNLPSSIGMNSLKVFELSGCSKLEKFPQISGIMNELPVLCLDSTAIKELPSSIKNLQGLVNLSLKDCRELTSLPSSICRIQSLRYVNLSGCSKFEEFPPIAGQEDMERLKELHLEGTSIKEFLPSTSALENLEVLSLRDCKALKTLPASIHMMASLQSLILSGCSNLKKFPQVSGTIYWLSELHLDGVGIEEFPPSINNLRRLSSLLLRACGEIRSLPNSIFQLECLNMITVSGCSKFVAFPEVVEEKGGTSVMGSLFTLRLEGCTELKSLPRKFYLLKSLRFVTLSGCSKFEVFPEILEDMRELRELHLDGTSIRKLVPSIDRLKKLMLLNMTNCRSLRSLPDSICNLSYLTGLTLSGCSNLHNLPNNLGKLESLVDLEVAGSGIDQPPFSPPSSSSSTYFLVGMERHMNEMEKLLCLDQVDDVRTVGIWGDCGIGKTTVATAIYEKIAPQFEQYCFVENVNEGFRKHGTGAVYIQEKLSRMFMETGQSSGIMGGGSDMIMERLCMTKVLLVLDDVRSKTQIGTLLGEAPSFGPGSRIIVTTREKPIMSGFQIYCPKLLDDEAVGLLRHFAFKTVSPSAGYDPHILDAISRARCLPLALKVLGSFLCDKSISQWKRSLPTYSGADRVFKAIFGDLHDSEKTIFLDLAFFFEGMKKDYVTEILQSCGFFPYSGLRVLIDRSLLTISHQDGTLKMYDSIQEIADDMARTEGGYGIGEPTRLWRSDGIDRVAPKHRVTSAVRAINIDLSNSTNVRLDAEAFVRMEKLRLLRIVDKESLVCKQTLSKNLEFLSHELRCLIWHGCPLRSLPSNFHPWNLVDLDMRGSLIEQLCEGTKLLRNLKFINLSRCLYLKKTPDLSEATNLQKLILDACTSLSEVHPSILDHRNLVFLSLEGCVELQIFPDGIRMKSLKTLNLSGCSKLEKFPDILEVMTELTTLGLDETAIKGLRPTIQLLQGLQSLSVRNCTSLVSLPDSICRLKHLAFLNLSGCSKLSYFPDNLRNTQSLEIIGLEELTFCTRTKEIESEVSSDEFISLSGSSSESGEEADGKEEKVEMEGVVQGDDCSTVGGIFRSLHFFLSWLHELYVRGRENLRRRIHGIVQE